MTLTPKQVPYTGQKGSDATKHDADAPTIQALKRAMVRMDYLDKPLDELDNRWPAGGAFDQSFGRWKLDVGLANDHTYGENAWEKIRAAKVKSGSHKGEYALDSYAQNLIQTEASNGGATNEDKVRAKITEFCQRAIAEPDWYYSQNRAVDVSVNPDGPTTSDCSGSTIQAFYYAKKQTGLAVKDPSQQGWSGYGNTNYYEDDWPTVTGQYKVGDLAHYDGHVCCCFKAGDSDTSDWFSFGSEPPSKRKLNYRSDFRKVVRPDLL
jgi:hypothetical protein